MNFKTTQYALTAHLRDPDQSPAPAGIEDRRLQIYRDLLYNNVEGFLASQFPVLRKILTDAQWHILVRQYFKTHQSQTPFFLEIGTEFLDYLSHEHQPIENEPPFLYELAHHEWVELEVMTSTETVTYETSAVINSEAQLILNPTLIISAYTFPVHRINLTHQPTTPNEHPVFLLVARNVDDEVTFMETTALVARTLELLQQGAQTLAEALTTLYTEVPKLDPQTLQTGLLDALTQCHQKQLVIQSNPNHSRNPL